MRASSPIFGRDGTESSLACERRQRRPSRDRGGNKGSRYRLCQDDDGATLSARGRERSHNEGARLTKRSSVDARGFLPRRAVFDRREIVTLLDVKVAAVLTLRLGVVRKLGDSVDVVGIGARRNRSMRSQRLVDWVRRHDSRDLDRQVRRRDVASEATGEQSSFDCRDRARTRQHRKLGRRGRL